MFSKSSKVVVNCVLPQMEVKDSLNEVYPFKSVVFKFKYTFL
jgi:hypothetical protein